MQAYQAARPLIQQYMEKYNKVEKWYMLASQRRLGRHVTDKDEKMYQLVMDMLRLYAGIRDAKMQEAIPLPFWINKDQKLVRGEMPSPPAMTRQQELLGRQRSLSLPRYRPEREQSLREMEQSRRAAYELSRYRYS